MINSGKDDEGIKEMEALLKSDPFLIKAHNDLGGLYYKKGDKDKALAHFKKTPKLKPEEVPMVKELADSVYLNNNRNDDAMEIYMKILDIMPDDIETLLVIGDIFISQGKLQHARSIFNKVLEIEPQNHSAIQALDSLSGR